ncbi:tyrosine-type recombinase/integrase [Thauera mechernichensis]|uniref:Tyrosine-type recombinase/integrase n=1 Tax=Thauera mechernichensis TaxID=82788 RepID=A0ABW3WIH7_9RHOO|nr:tyrosine-type recombinase/integrase [Thauera mechernichensis]MDG3063251.1 tyrosine-type recombinase/integrase [Thauera mechernichensis]
MSFISATLGRLVPRFRTVAEWAEVYSKVVAAKPIQLKTKQNRHSYIKRIVGELGDRRVGAVRPHEIAAFIGSVAADHPHLARRMLIETRDMFREAVNYGWLDRDPTMGIRTPRVRVARMRLTFEQWSAIHAWAERHSPPWVSRMLVLALVTGQRRADLRSMRFGDVWPELVDGVAVPCLHIEQQKTGTRVAIPTGLRLEALGMTVADAVEQCRDYAPREGGSDGWLLRKTTGVPPVGASMSWRFEQAREGALATADADPPSLHECRSLAARMYDAQGVRDVQTLLGHSHASMTELYKDDRGLDRRQGRWKVVSMGQPFSSAP